MSHALNDPYTRVMSDDERRMYRGGVWLLILAETMAFLSVFSTRFLLAGVASPLQASNKIGVVITVALIVSVIPATMALRRVKAHDCDGMAWHLMAAALLGAIALAAMLFDWTTLAFPAGSDFGENYILSTGYHALHIVIGVIWLGAAAIAGRRGAYTQGNHWVVEGGVLFWYFIVVMWIALYLIFFVV